MKIELLKGITELKELKSNYRKLAFKYHPDKATGSVELMQQLNNEYSYLLNQLKASTEDIKQEEQFASEVAEVLSKLWKCEGLDIELVGTWIWVSGNTKPHKELLKENGFHWNKTRKLWQRKPSDFKGRIRNSKHTSETLKDIYGSKVLKGSGSKTGDQKTRSIQAAAKK